MQQFQRLAFDAVAVHFSEGLQEDPPTAAAPQGVTILPGSRVLKAPARFQQLSVLSKFADGSTRDVTRLTVFSSSDAAVADVTVNGLVEFRQAGEVAILCRYLDIMETVRLTYLEPRPGFVWKDVPETNYKSLIYYVTDSDGDTLLKLKLPCT